MQRYGNLLQTTTLTRQVIFYTKGAFRHEEADIHSRRSVHAAPPLRVCQQQLQRYLWL
jgi:hypothetical protein